MIPKRQQPKSLNESSERLTERVRAEQCNDDDDDEMEG